MKTIKCSKCGCEMSAISEACPMCGTPTHFLSKEVIAESQQSDYVRRSDVKMLDGLKEVIDTMIADKRINPMSNIVVTTEDGGYIDGREYFVDWIIGVPTNYTNKASITLYPKSVVRISPLRGIAYNILKISMLEIQFSNGGH